MIPSSTRWVRAPRGRRCAMCGAPLRAGSHVVVRETVGAWGRVEATREARRAGTGADVNFEIQLVSKKDVRTLLAALSAIGIVLPHNVEPVL